MPDVRARDVAAALYAGCTGLIELRALPSRARLFARPDAPNQIAAWIRAHTREDLYWGVATRRDESGTLAHCHELGALYADIDRHDAPAHTARARLDALPPASIVIDSGGGWHAYWLLREPIAVQADPAGLTRLLRRLATAAGGDLAAAEPARVLRVPGTRNHKYSPPRRVTIEMFEPDRRYSISDLEPWLPADTAEPARDRPDAGLEDEIPHSRRNDTLYRLARSLRAKGLPPAAIIETLRSVNTARCRPPLDAAEVDRIAANALKQPDREKQTDASTLELTALRDLLAEPDETVDYLVEDRIAFASVNLLPGKPKSGKSTTVRALALEVARGGSWLGFACLARPVWYLALEDKRSEVRRHFRRMGATGAEPIRFLFRQPADDLIGRLHALAAREQPGLIVVDTLQRLIKAADLNDYAEVTTKLTPILQLARETGAAVLLVHHAGKSERAGLDAVLGSTALTGSVDNVFLLARTDRYRVLSSIQRIGPDLPETVITLDAGTGQVHAGPSRHDADRGTVEAAILAALADDAEPRTEAQLEDAIEGRTALKREGLRALVEAGRVTRTGRGGKGDPFRYSILVPDVGNNKTSTPADEPVPCSCSLVPSYSREQENKNADPLETPDAVALHSCSLVPGATALHRVAREQEPSAVLRCPICGRPGCDSLLCVARRHPLVQAADELLGPLATLTVERLPS